MAAASAVEVLERDGKADRFRLEPLLRIVVQLAEQFNVVALDAVAGQLGDFAILGGSLWVAGCLLLVGLSFEPLGRAHHGREGDGRDGTGASVDDHFDRLRDLEPEATS